LPAATRTCASPAQPVWREQAEPQDSARRSERPGAASGSRLYIGDGEREANGRALTRNDAGWQARLYGYKEALERREVAPVPHYNMSAAIRSIRMEEEMMYLCTSKTCPGTERVIPPGAAVTCGSCDNGCQMHPECFTRHNEARHRGRARAIPLPDLDLPGPMAA
jgi:hypothetical protein